MNVEKAESRFAVLLTYAKGTVSHFLDVGGLKLSASLSYYTTFSLAPLLVLAISIAGLIFGQEAAEGRIFEEINGLVGNKAAVQIQELIRNASLSGKKEFALVVGVVTLLIGATTVFGDMQDSIDRIWAVKAKPKKGWLKLIKDRLLSSSLIISIGFLLIVSLLLNGLLDALTDHLKRIFADTAVYVFSGVNILLSFVIIGLLFGLIFKFLPDVKIAWKDVRAGAFFTAILFLIGRVAIGFYIQTTGTESTYGAAGAIIVVLLWVYYSAAILYLGACFTRVYADLNGTGIEPSEFAVRIEEKEIERNEGQVASILKEDQKHV